MRLSCLDIGDIMMRQVYGDGKVALKSRCDPYSAACFGT
jgi:hypothetical protein